MKSAKLNLFMAFVFAVSFTQNSTAQTASGSSSSGSALAIVGEGITGAVGVYEVSQCGPHNYPACAMAALCALQLIQSLEAQGGTDAATGAYTTGTGTTAGSTTDASPNLVSPTTSSSGGSNGTPGQSTAGLAALQKIQSGLASAGVTTNPTTGTVSLPNGVTVPAGANAAAMKDLGLDPTQVDQAVASANKVASDMMANPVGYQAIGGGSRSAHAVNPSATEDPSSRLAALNGAANKRRPTSVKDSVAGLSRKLGNENIGVKGDNIFEMVNRRYQAQAKQNAFLNEK